MPPGTVYLVGAGPGDPSLLTVRAQELLRAADVVAYDALISDGVLAMVGRQAELVAVGHRGQGSSRAPYRIHPSVIAEAQAGRTVVRLKSGDPFIFGRGGEEAEELLAAGIPYEVVPGVSAALGAAAYAGIPLTHRDCASDVTFATGHDLLTGGESGSLWPRLARGRGTIVLFMASKKLAENLARLVDGGRAASTPAAYVACATGARQRTIVGTLADLVAKTADMDREDPALVIVGEVVALRKTLAWREGRPLDGRRVLVARARAGASSLATQLRALGATVVEAPSIENLPLDDTRALDAALAQLAGFDGWLFGCAAGVDATMARIGALGLDLRTLPYVPIIAIGAQAGARLRALGLTPAIEVAGACRDAVGTHASLLRSGRLLLVTGDDRRPSLVGELDSLGASVEVVTAYATVRCYPRVSREPFDAIVLPSSSAARHLYESELGGRLLDVPAVAIGPRTETAARRHGAQRIVRADSDDVAAAVGRTLELLSARVADEPRGDERVMT